MKNIKNILYIHGINSSGSTGRMLQKIVKEKFGENVNVIAPSISPYYVEARKTIDKVLKENDIDLIIGTSLGGFMTLDTANYFRIAINPTLMPSKTLPKIGTPESIYKTYEFPETALKYAKISEDKFMVYGMFGTNDTVVDNKDEFSKLFNVNNQFLVEGAEHQFKENDFKNSVFPLIEKIDNAITEYKEHKLNF